MSKPLLNQPAPLFNAPVCGGGFAADARLDLATLLGRPVVLYFYPKDDTPGCTRQACGLRDAWEKLRRKAHVIGVSPDPVRRHAKFISKYELPFALVADEDHAIATAYGVWVEKSLYGRKYMGVERSTFILDAEGRLQAILEKVKPDEHLELVLQALRSME